MNAEKLAERPDVYFVKRAANGVTRALLEGRLRNAASKSALAERRVGVERELGAALRGVDSKPNLLGNFALPQTPMSIVDTNGVLAEGASLVQTDLDVTGTGVKIGVVSEGVNSLAEEQALGALPADVTVLPGYAGSGDEGTAMLEIVYDMAPGAQLYFAAGDTGESNLADAIEALAAAGCTIIVNDTFYIEEGVFEEDFIGQAVDDVTSRGVLFFTAAGNQGNEDTVTQNPMAAAGTWEGDFTDSGQTMSYSYEGLFGKTAKIHAFAPGQNSDLVISSSNPYGFAYLETNLTWSDPFDQACNDYDLFLYDPGGELRSSSTDLQECALGQYAGESVLPPDAGDSLVITLVTDDGSGEARALHLQNFDLNGLQLSTHGCVAGLAGTASAITVGSTTAAGLATTFTDSTQPDAWSCDGPRTIFYNPDDSAITPGDFLLATASDKNIIPKVNFLAADCGRTDIAEVAEPDQTGSYFCGTSAAAPHAAGIAALIMSANSSLTPAQVKAVMTNNVILPADGFTSDSTGSGIAMANLSVFFGSGVLTPVTIASVPTDQAFTISGAQCRPGAYTTPWRTTLPVAYANNQCIITMPSSISTGVGSRVKFTDWENLSTNATRIITIPLPAVAPTYTATYTQQQYLVTLTPSPAAGGTVAATVTADSPWYNSGASTSVTATANAGYKFANFTGDLTGATNPGSLTVTEPEFVTANFDISLTTQVAATGGGTVSPASGYFPDGVVDISATPDPGYAFGTWTANVVSPSLASTSIDLTDPQTVTATFNPGLTTQVGGAGGGTVSPASGFYAPGTVVPISATANAGYTFSSWAGNVANAGSASTTVTLDGPQTVTANFSKLSANSVPNVVGLTQAAATTAITGAGLVVGTVTPASSSTVASGDVISESPVAGASVAAGSAVNIVVSTGPAPVLVPNVVGDTVAAATAAITGAGLVLGTNTPASSSTVASGDVISEGPVAGTSVAAGSAVNIVVSTGPAKVAVPNVVGDTVAAAKTALTNVGLVLGTNTPASSSTVASGDVISESPVAGTSVAAGSAVNIIVSTGPAPVSVPNVVGLSETAAKAAITGAGLVLGTNTPASSSTVASGDVISESPVAGTSVNVGSAVNIVVSTGPAKVAVPNVVGDTVAAATTAIAGAGLVLGTNTPASSGTVPSGDVISESPVAGTSVAAGSAVNLVVSTGPATTNVTGSVSITSSGFAYSRVSKLFIGTFTVTNKSAGAISGPMEIVLAGLPAGVTVSNAAGTFGGNPYLLLAAGSLASGASVTVTVQISDPSLVSIACVPAVYSGGL